MRAKTFGYGNCVPGDRNIKLSVMDFARAINKLHRAPGQHIGPLTRTTLEVLQAILWGFHNAKTGRCFPSYEAIAAKAGCSRSTVGLAIKVLEQYGVLSWCHRLIRVGAKVFRTSNGYHFTASENGSGTRNQQIQESISARKGSFRYRVEPAAPLRSVEEMIRIINSG